jgi:hypothetical protein
MSTWNLTVEEDPATGDLILTFPQELLDQQGWQEGDTLEWVKSKDDSWIIQKVKE